MLDTVVISGDDVCCSVVFGTLVGVFVFSVMWSKLLITYAISCPLGHQCTSDRESSVCSHLSVTECGMFVMYCMQCYMSVSPVL